MVAQYHKSRDALYEGQFDDKMKNLQRGGEGIIAVSYEARARGIKRGETRYLRLVLKLSDWPICDLDSDWSVIQYNLYLSCKYNLEMNLKKRLLSWKHQLFWKHC